MQIKTDYTIEYIYHVRNRNERRKITDNPKKFPIHLSSNNFNITWLAAWKTFVRIWSLRHQYDVFHKNPIRPIIANVCWCGDSRFLIVLSKSRFSAFEGTNLSIATKLPVCFSVKHTHTYIKFWKTHKRQQKSGRMISQF